MREGCRVITETFKPRFCETDALGHINNVSYSAWIEQGRTSLLMERPDVELEANSNFVLAKLEVNYLAEGFFGCIVETQTCVSKVGTTSIHINSKIYQNGKQLIDASSILVYIDLISKSPKPVTGELRKLLEAI